MRVEKIDNEGLLVDLIQYSLNYHHKSCKASLRRITGNT